MSNLVDYSVKTADKSIKGKLDIKMLMPKIPKHIQVYIAVAFSEREFLTYSKIFNKTLSTIPSSFLIADSLNRHYNVSLSPLFFVLPDSGRFSSSIYEVMCNSLEKKRVVAILVVGESPAAFTVSLAAITSNIPVLWARGGTPNPPGNLEQQNLLEIRLEPSELQLFEAIRGVFLATHWHSFTVLASPSLASRCATILNFPPLNPKVVAISRNPHNIFRKLADVSRSTRGVVLLLCDLTDAIIVMKVAKKLSMIDGHFVWIWIDTTTKPASFLSLPDSLANNLTKKYSRYLKKVSSSRSKEDDDFYQNDDVNADWIAEKSEKEEKECGKKNIKTENKPNNKSEHRNILKLRKRRNVMVKDAKNADDVLEGKTLFSKNSGASTINSPKRNKIQPKESKIEQIYKLHTREVKRETESSSDWERLTSMNYLHNVDIPKESPMEKKSVEEFSAPVSRIWGKITEHFPERSSGRIMANDDLRGTDALPVGLLSVKPEPMRLDRHLLKGSVRLLVSTFHTVLKKSAEWLNVLDTDSSCWIKPSFMNKNFSEMYAREIRQAVGNSLSGQTQFQEGDRADRSLLANFQILNLVPEKFHVNFNNDDNVIEDAVLYWRQVGKVLGRNAHLNTIVWPGGDLVASALSARTRSVFRIVTALAPPFVMEGALDEDGQCLRGIMCHRVLNSDKDNLTLVFNEMETQERMENEVEELGTNERTEKTVKFFDQNYFEYHSTKYRYKSSCCYGLAMDLLENVAQELEFEFHLYIIPDGAYGAKSHVWKQGTPYSKWNGIVGDLVSGAAHMSFAALSVSKQRSQVIDFSTPYFFSGVSFLAAPTQKSEVPLLAFLLPFSTELWIAIFTSLNITAMAVACYEWLSPFGLNPWGRQRSRNFSIASALWVMWGLLCGHLVAFKAPKSWPNKFLINVWGGFSVIFVASYTANIAALIAGLFFHNSVSDYHDRSLLTQRVGAPKSSSVDYYIHRANQHLWEHMQKYSFDDVETGISLLRNGSLDILVADTPILDYYRATDHGCKLQKIVEAINEDTYAIGMNKGFPLKESISAVISKYSNNGYMDILTEKWYGGLPCFKMSPSVELTDVSSPRPLGVAAVAGVFLLLVLGMVFGIIILILEHLFYRYTLPILRHQPKGTIWRSRNVMFFSQKLYRFINCVELVSPHHAARELVHTLRQGQITSLFQKSVKRKEHEQRRRRKSKAQFFEMIQEIRRVQQEEKVEPKHIQNISGTNVESSPKIQLKGFLNSPRSLKHFCSSKASVSPETSIDVPDHLNPMEIKKPSKSPSRLDIRQFSKELFSLPRSPKSPKVKTSGTLDGRRTSLNMEDTNLKISKSLDIRLSAKDIRIQNSKAIGRRLSKDTSSWITSSPPDVNSRRKSHQEMENTFKDSFQVEKHPNEREFSSSLTLPSTISKAATIRLASRRTTDVDCNKNVRPRLPSPPRSPVVGLCQTRSPEISSSNAGELNVYDTIGLKEEKPLKNAKLKNSHCRSKSLDNKYLNCDGSWVKVNITSDEENSIKNQTVSYATLDLKRKAGDDEKKKKINTNTNSKTGAAKNSKVTQERDPGMRQKVLPSNKRTGTASEEEATRISFTIDDLYPIYAKPQKTKKERKEEESTNFAINRKLRASPKKEISKLKESRASSAPETNFPTSANASSTHHGVGNFQKKYFVEYDYYSKCKGFRESGTFPEQSRKFQSLEMQFGSKGHRTTSSPSRQHRSTDSKRKLQASSRRSRSVPEHSFVIDCEEKGAEYFQNSKLETPILVLRFSASPSRNSATSKSRSREESELPPTPVTSKGRPRRQDVRERDGVASLRKQISEPP